MVKNTKLWPTWAKQQNFKVKENFRSQENSVLHSRVLRKQNFKAQESSSELSVETKLEMLGRTFMIICHVSGVSCFMKAS